jgi:hypothetical protein
VVVVPALAERRQGEPERDVQLGVLGCVSLRAVRGRGELGFVEHRDQGRAAAVLFAQRGERCLEVVALRG